MPERSPLQDLSDEPSFQMWMDFENVCDRYLSLVDQGLPSLLPNEAIARMEKAYLERTIVFATRRDQRTFHLMMQRVRSQQWYADDRARLSRYVALIALFPLVFEKAENMPLGETAANLAKDRKTLSIDHPYLFNESWPEVDEDHVGAMDEHVQQMDLDIWGDKDVVSFDLDNEGLLQVQAIDLMFLEEALPVLTSIRGTSSQLAGEGLPGLSDGALDIIGSKEHEMSSMMARFVLECMFLRHLRSADPKNDKELMGTWQEGIELGRVEMDLSPGSLDLMLHLLIAVHGEEDCARGMMSEGAEAAADLIGKKALPIMLKAADVPVDDRTWPPLMHDLVMLQIELNVGAEENIRRMAEQGRIDGRPELLCTAQFLKAECYLKKGMKEKATKACQELSDVIRKHIDVEDVLIQIPEAVHLLMQNGQRPLAKKLMEVGLRATANRPDREWLRFDLKELLNKI
jgi:hypothetical protein